MADGLFYNDLREPFMTVPPAAVTLAATAKALYTAAAFPVLGSHYFGRVGKKISIRMAGVMTTAATPGNGSFNVYFGTGADANGVLLMTGTPRALTASQTAAAWALEVFITCRTTGIAGTLMCNGIAHFASNILATTLQPVMLPEATMAVSGAIDLSVAANIVSVQYLRSGSTAETMQVLDMEVLALN